MCKKNVRFPTLLSEFSPYCSTPQSFQMYTRSAWGFSQFGIVSWLRSPIRALFSRYNVMECSESEMPLTWRVTESCLLYSWQFYPQRSERDPGCDNAIGYCLHSLCNWGWHYISWLLANHNMLNFNQPTHCMCLLLLHGSFYGIKGNVQNWFELKSAS